jgi:hypothetical protein
MGVGMVGQREVGGERDASRFTDGYGSVYRTGKRGAVRIGQSEGGVFFYPCLE